MIVAPCGLVLEESDQLPQAGIRNEGVFRVGVSGRGFGLGGLRPVVCGIVPLQKQR